jgi:hypothetical protein
MPEGVMLARFDDLVRDAERLEIEVVVREARFLRLREAALHRRILDLAQVRTRVVGHGMRVAHVPSLRSGPRSVRAGEHVRQAHEVDELEEPVRGPAQPDLATATSRCELQARESVNGDRVRVHARDVAANDAFRARQQTAYSVAETRKVVSADRAADYEGDHVPPGCLHRPLDRHCQ